MAISIETKIKESAYFSAAKVVHSDKKRRTKRQHSHVLNDDMNSESESSCESKIGHFSSLTGAEAVHSNKKQRMERQHSNVPNGLWINRLEIIIFSTNMLWQDWLLLL